MLPYCISATPVKESEPVKREKSGFVRNSSIRLSDTQARRSVQEEPKCEGEKCETQLQSDVPSTDYVGGKSQAPNLVTDHQKKSTSKYNSGRILLIIISAASSKAF